MSVLVIELNIARRNAGSYPPGHPLIDVSLDRVLSHYTELLSQKQELVLGVTRDALMFAGTYLDRANQVYRDFAKNLFERGIGTIILKHGLSRDELRSITALLGLKREEILARGGITKLWTEAGINSLQVRQIYYDQLAVTEETSVSISADKIAPGGIWEKFVKGLSDGRIDPSGSVTDLLDPEILASIVNESFTKGEKKRDIQYVDVISEFIRASANFNSAVDDGEGSRKRLADFLSNLTPELRRQFLSTTFHARKSDGAPFALDIAPFLSADAIIDALEDANNSRLTVPPLVMGLLQKLGRQAPSTGVSQAFKEESEDDTARRLGILFQEHASEEYIPDSYRNKLDAIITMDSMEGVAELDREMLLATLQADSLENRISEILLFLLVNSDGGDSDSENSLDNTLCDLFETFVRSGDFYQVTKLLTEISSPSVPVGVKDRLLCRLASPENLEELIAGLRIWGKDAYPNTRQIITLLGPGIIDPLLDCMAEEENMSVRRFIMDRILEFGKAGTDMIVARLSDNRWYVVRNLVVMLREINEPGVLPVLKSIVRHQNDKVRLEVLRTMLYFNDQSVEQQLMEGLEDQRHEMRLASLAMAGVSKSTRIVDRLSEIALKQVYTQQNYEIKEAAVRALLESGRQDLVLILKKLFASRNLFSPRLHDRFKANCLQALENFDPTISMPFLRRIAEQRSKTAIVALSVISRMEKKAR